jgi:phosphopantetheine adenylyltransferase
MVYGRFNPVHLGHIEIFKRALAFKSEITNSDVKIYVTSTVDKIYNPLPYNVKVKMISDYCPEIVPYIQHDTKTLFDNLKTINEEYDNLILLCGSDRHFIFESVINNYNGNLYNFDSIQVLNMGDRVKSPYSSTFMRCCVEINNFESFKKCLPQDKPELNAKYFEIISAFKGSYDIQD